MKRWVLAPAMLAVLTMPSSTVLAAPQAAAALEAKRAAMKKVEFLVGNWEGKAVSTFTGSPRSLTERRSSKAGWMACS